MASMRIAPFLIVALLPLCAEAQAPSPALGAYECWFFSTPRMGLNFTLEAGGRYVDSEGARGSFAFDAAAKTITFKGGVLDGQKVVYPPKQIPTVSFRNAKGDEVSFCEAVR